MNPNPSELLLGLPGAERIFEGLRDYHENRHTMAACLVRMARRRLAKAGLLEPAPPRDDGAELDLYQLLSHEGNQAHSCYNALMRELISFEHALDHRLSRL
ncbi:MAG: hypothetical protein Q8Q59_14215 [Luteolibacter sp.]|jgi:hypothetical protein|nr:hypothetical protein [Luteolibacter sp.]